MKLADDAESRQLVGRHQYVMEETPGRGLVHLEEVEIFQVALPVYAKDSCDLVQTIQYEAKEMASDWTGTVPVGIPIMPETLSFESFQAMSSVQASIVRGDWPLELEFLDVDSVGLSLKRFKHLVYLSDRAEQVQAHL
ncbi:hypothetical protein [Streptococcus cuniculi]|uniref:Uncharacterized protein n=1 Tax=Streptococcus cuniculi TaxID=1432788 RepID=A0A4Y9JE58_9STRE|nr:hypothetical protein [Streptococcus cuniculi]MBF0777945.1 hypothetical protein [Streptococcus cuniculi]TFU98239.1 hypothetical protein E4T82_04335 [Streptococcus cuniculi]